MKQLARSTIFISFSLLLLCSFKTAVNFSFQKETTDELALCKLAIRDKDGTVRFNAIAKLKDQNLLAKVAIEGRFWISNSNAVDKLTDQTLIAKVAVEANDSHVRNSAVQKLTDQNVLKMLATDNKYQDVRHMAITKLVDQETLTKIIKEDSDPNNRIAAARNLTDPDLLSVIAAKDEDKSVKEIAGITRIGLLTDQKVIIQIASDSTIDDEIRRIAVSKITNQSVLTRFAIFNNNRNLHADAIAAIDSISVLKLIAGDLWLVSNNAENCLARMKLAILELDIEKLLPEAIFIARIDTHQSQQYTQISQQFAISSQLPGSSITVSGEFVSCELNQKGKTLARWFWRSDFPKQTNSTFIPAEVNAVQFFSELFRIKVFTKEILTGFLQSGIPEVRLSAGERFKQL